MISEWADEISLALKGKKNIQLPYIIFLLLAKIGDVLKMLHINFPLTSFRLSNMTTRQRSLIDKKLFSDEPFSRKEAIDITIKWYEKYYGKML